MIIANFCPLSCAVCCSTNCYVLRIARMKECITGDLILLAARSKAGVCGLSLAGIMGSSLTEVMRSVVSVVCCQVGLSATS